MAKKDITLIREVSEGVYQCTGCLKTGNSFADANNQCVCGKMEREREFYTGVTVGFFGCITTTLVVLGVIYIISW